MTMQKSPFIWIARPPRQRLTHVYFRRELNLPAKPARAQVSLFAQTLYHLRVNGVLVGTGPARSHPDAPEYDTYDLTAFLRPGPNVVAVQAAHTGVQTFHHLYRPGALRAWGQVKLPDGQTLSLSTGQDWRCCRSHAHEPNPPRLSFAVGPLQILDERLAPTGWDTPGPCAGEWETPVTVDASHWGTPQPRTIPPLTEQTCLPRLLLGAYPHQAGEEVISFAEIQDYDPSATRAPKGYMLAYTRIWSPRAQTVEVGTWWGEFFLNGGEVGKEPAGILRGRDRRRFDLREGWNLLLMAYMIVEGIWEMHLAYPSQAGLRFAADGDDGGPEFRVVPAMGTEAGEALIEKLPADSLDALPELAAMWRDKPASPLPVSPAKAVAWRAHGERLDVLGSQVADLTAPAGQGRSFVFDMGRMTLGRIFVEFEGPAGTVVDVAYAEDLRDGRPHLYKSAIVQTGERHVGAGGQSRLETFERRGFRYLQVDVTGHDTDVRIARVGAVSNVYPYTQRGRFECSDALLNTLYDYGWLTLRLCSEDVITDTPWRERTLYGGDLLPEAATTLVTARDMRLVRRCLDVYAQCQSPQTGNMAGRAPQEGGGRGISDYPLLVLINAAWYCRLENDLEFARRYEPVFARLFEMVLSHRRPDGLFDTGGGFIAHGYRCKGPCNGPLNAVVAGALDAWADLLTLLGQAEPADRARQLARETADAIARLFWDDSVSAFADLRHPDGTLEGHTVHAQAWPMLWTKVAADRQALASAWIARQLDGFDPYRDGECVSTYDAFYALGALYRAGQAGLAERLMRTVYRLMIEQPTGTIWEHAHPEKSLSHAWSTAPNYYLASEVLGVQVGLTRPDGLGRVVIAPQAQTLQYAHGTVPHPLGDVRVSWEVHGDTLWLEYAAPEGVPVDVTPRGRLAELALIARRME